MIQKHADVKNAAYSICLNTIHNLKNVYCKQKNQNEVFSTR